MQIIILLGFGLGTALLMAGNYKKWFKASDPAAPPSPPGDPSQIARHMVLAAGTIADMGPVRDAAGHLERIADRIEDGLHEMRETRRVWEQILKQMEIAAVRAQYAEHRSHRQEDRT